MLIDVTPSGATYQGTCLDGTNPGLKPWAILSRETV